MSYNLLVLCEKASARKNFEKALGGKTGTFNGESYKLTNSHGHLLTLVDPQDQVSDEAEKVRYSSWTDMKTMPWQLKDFNWHKKAIVSKNPRTGKQQSSSTDITNIRNEARDCDAIVIATDNDPSGEGDLLGWEIVNAIHWNKKVYRIRFADEEPASIKKALKAKKDVTQQSKQGEYLKGEARNRFDFASMQLTRIATYAGRSAGYSVKVLRLGRLKSVIVRQVYDQLEAVKNYVKTPYFEVKFKDPAGHIFSRKFNDEDSWRFKDKTAGNKDLQQYSTDDVVNIKKTRKTSAPGQLLDLARLGSLLAPQGYSAKEVLATYQKMYQDGVVSYPRTEDKKITQGQYDALVPLVDQIADVVGVNKKLLTHRTIRKKHLAKNAAHGANRPGLKVPKSLSSLDKYGASAQAIYKTLAYNFLAIFGEDYVYDAVTANLKQNPSFKTSFSVPVEQNYKLIFDDSDKDDSDSKNSTAGPQAEPYLYEGANPKPKKPTQASIMKFLEKHDVGTGATRLSTLSQLTSGSAAELKATKGALKLTDTGTVNALLIKDTWIADVKITKELFNQMDEVATFKKKTSDILRVLTNIVVHDKKVILQNGTSLATSGLVFKSLQKKFTPKQKDTTTYKGKEVKFNIEWGGEKMTDQEIADLKAGKSVILSRTSKKGKPYRVKGHFGDFKFKGKTYYGFVKDEFVN